MKPGRAKSSSWESAGGGRRASPRDAHVGAVGRMRRRLVVQNPVERVPQSPSRTTFCVGGGQMGTLSSHMKSVVLENAVPPVVVSAQMVPVVARERARALAALTAAPGQHSQE
jgi:hypothetical protein